MKKNNTLLIALGITALLAFVPFFVKKDNLLTYLCMILLYISLASSWNILGGYTGQVSLGHSAFFGLGALATRLLWFAGWNIILGMLVGGIVAIAFALLIGSPAFKLRGAYFTIGTLALGQILFSLKFLPCQFRTCNPIPWFPATISSLPLHLSPFW